MVSHSSSSSGKKAKVNNKKRGSGNIMKIPIPLKKRRQSEEESSANHHTSVQDKKRAKISTTTGTTNKKGTTTDEVKGLRPQRYRPRKSKAAAADDDGTASIILPPVKDKECEVAKITRQYNSFKEYFEKESLKDFQELSLRFVSRSFDVCFPTSARGPSIGIIYSIVHHFANLRTKKEVKEFAEGICIGDGKDVERSKVAKIFRESYNYRYELRDDHDYAIDSTTGKREVAVFAVKTSGSLATKRLRLGLHQVGGIGRHILARLLCKLVDARVGGASVKKRREWLGNTIRYAKIPETNETPPHVRQIWQRPLVLPTKLKKAFPFAVTRGNAERRLIEVDTDNDDEGYVQMEIHAEKDEKLEVSFRSMGQQIKGLKETIKDNERIIKDREAETAQLRIHNEQLKENLQELEAELPLLKKEQELHRKFYKLFGMEGRSLAIDGFFMLCIEILEARKNGQKVSRARVLEFHAMFARAFGKDPNINQPTWENIPLITIESDDGGLIGEDDRSHYSGGGVNNKDKETVQENTFPPADESDAGPAAAATADDEVDTMGYSFTLATINLPPPPTPPVETKKDGEPKNLEPTFELSPD